jgi:hypothetical protein
MKKYGIRKIYYSTDNGDIVCEQVRDMVSTHRRKWADRREATHE